MASWFVRTSAISASSRAVQVAATAVLSGVVVAGTILVLQRARRQSQLDDLKRSIPELDDVADQASSPLLFVSLPHFPIVFFFLSLIVSK
jgi:hypothetical protein